MKNVQNFIYFTIKNSSNTVRVMRRKSHRLTGNCLKPVELLTHSKYLVGVLYIFLNIQLNK